MQQRTWTGKRLKTLMEKVNMDKLQLAAHLGATSPTITNWLNNKCRPNLVYRRELERMEQELTERVKA
jgi:transcriptional regulator with XRE-family HTH domain